MSQNYLLFDINCVLLDFRELWDTCTNIWGQWEIQIWRQRDTPVPTFRGNVRHLSQHVWANRVTDPNIWGQCGSPVPTCTNIGWHRTGRDKSWSQHGQMKTTIPTFENEWRHRSLHWGSIPKITYDQSENCTHELLMYNKKISFYIHITLQKSVQFLYTYKPSKKLPGSKLEYNSLICETCILTLFSHYLLSY